MTTSSQDAQIRAIRTLHIDVDSKIKLMEQVLSCPKHARQEAWKPNPGRTNYLTYG